MRYTLAGLLTTLILAAGSLSAIAQAEQPQDPEKLKQGILDKVKARLQEEHKKIVERLSKIIDEELGKSKPVDPPKGGGGAAKIRELQRKLQQLDDERDAVAAQIRGIQREEADAKLRKEAESVPEDNETISGMFEEAMRQHTEGTEALKKADRKAAEKAFGASIPEFKKLYYRFADRRYGAICAYNVACGYSLLDSREQALDWIELSMKAGYNQAADFDHMRQDSDLDNLRKERRYQKIMLDK